jgi:Ca2+-binding EF-hand superfamily protein
MPGQGGGGRWGGGGGRGGFDPNQLFNMMANGKEVVSRADITNPRFQGMFDRFAEQAGVTNGQLTREQFVSGMQQRMGQRGQGGPGGPAAAPAAPATEANNASSWAERSFQRLDQNGDGLLNYDEMAGDETLRAERDKWDTNKDGFIDLNEYRAYAEARALQRQSERGQSLDGVPMVLAEPAPAEEEEKKPVVYRAGKLPPGLPGWFSQLDSDGDGQIGLYEWRAGGRSIEEFQQIDRNGDGFLTMDEVLRYTRPSGTQTGAQSLAGAAPPGVFREDARAFNNSPSLDTGSGFDNRSAQGNTPADSQGNGRRRGRGFGGGRGGNGGGGGGNGGFGGGRGPGGG